LIGKGYWNPPLILETIMWNKDGLFIRAWGDRENEPMNFDVTTEVFYRAKYVDLWKEAERNRGCTSTWSSGQ
jgi:hypothetical protein